MSHLVSPNAYRLGRTQLWGNTEAIVLNSLLWRSHLCYPIGLVSRDSVQVSKTYHLLFYPIFFIYRYRNRFLYPRFYRHLRFLVWIHSLTFQKAETSLLAIWTRSLYRFSNRFTIRRKHLEWREWFKVVMVRGVSRRAAHAPITVSGFEWSISGRRYLARQGVLQSLVKLTAISSSTAFGYFRVRYAKAVSTCDDLFWRRYYRHSIRRLPILIASIVYALRVSEPKWLKAIRSEVLSTQAVQEHGKLSGSKRWQSFTTEASAKSLLKSKYSVSNALLSHLMSQELRFPVQVRAMNVFHYMLLKKIITPASYMSHLDYLMSRRTGRDQHAYKTYFDILNILFLQSTFANIEWVFLRIIKYTLFKMHRRNIKLKYFLRFIHNAIQALGQANRQFSIFRLVVHGKIKGGTHRTRTFTAGYGKPQLNSIGFNMRYCFDNIYSKYGEYGMHLIIGRRFQIDATKV